MKGTNSGIRSKVTLLFALFIYSIVPAFAQVPCSGDPDDPGYDPNGCNVPLDNWVIILIGLALYFGYKQLQKQKNLSL